MTFLEAQDAVKAYLHYDTASVSIQAKLDSLVPMALNNARLWAERQHNWAYSFVSCWIKVSALGLGDLHAGYPERVDVDNEEFAAFLKMRSVTAAFLENADGTLTPLMLRPLGAVQRLKIQKKDLQVDDPFWPETEDDGVFNTPFLTITGKQLGIRPKTACNVQVEGYRWLAAYSEFTDTDFLLEYVPDVLIWKALIDCNYITHTFVNRQDGNVGMPTQMLQDAWESAMNWDHYQHEAGINYQLG
jgi:hypothetical protein